MGRIHNEEGKEQEPEKSIKMRDRWLIRIELARKKENKKMIKE